MAHIVLAFIATLIPILMILLARWRNRPAGAVEPMSPVNRQHLDLFQGAEISEQALQASKCRLGHWLQCGEVQRVEASLEPGTGFAVQVRALTEIGTDSAGRVLERQLTRRLSRDPVEQTWYWIDLANGLRSLNRPSAIPRLTRCALKAEPPLAYFLAAEVAAFPDFRRYLRRDERALAVLHRALEGLRFGVQPSIFAAGRFAEQVGAVWRKYRNRFEPVAIRVFCAALRWLRRCPYALRLLHDEQRDRFERQAGRLASLAGPLQDYLNAARIEIPRQIVQGRVTPESLQAVHDLGCDIGDILVPLLASGQMAWSAESVAALAPTRSTAWSALLRREIVFRMKPVRSIWTSLFTRRSLQPNDELLPMLIRRLGDQPDHAVEEILVNAAESRHRPVRCAALEALGFRESVSREAMAVLLEARIDPDSTIAWTADAALARLGEVRALQRFRHRLASEEPEHLHWAIDWIARMELTMLWPDLDRLADAENPEVAFHACEALEHLREQMIRQSWRQGKAA